MAYFGLRHILTRGALAAALLGASMGTGFAATTLKMDFVTHAAFFSAETKQPKALDPQAFVRDPAAAEAVGPQGIKHAASVRPALIDLDARTLPVHTADDKPLGFNLGAWLDAKGSVTISDADGMPKLTATFSGLVPNGKYSLFENHFDQKPIGFTPMDGTGQANTFTAKADGTAEIALTLTHIPTHANAVLLVYHSDGLDHGLEKGPIGVVAHHQLIARPE